MTYLMLDLRTNERFIIQSEEEFCLYAEELLIGTVMLIEAYDTEEFTLNLL